MDTAMTTDLQRTMARYEDARIAYKKAVLASLNERSRGENIREAIREFQKASADLRRLTGGEPRPRPTALRPQAAIVRPRPSPQGSFAPVGFFRRLLSAS
jgi:hypothetical protein